MEAAAEDGADVNISCLPDDLLLRVLGFLSEGRIGRGQIG